jgi:hypothetical protein
LSANVDEESERSTFTPDTIPDPEFDKSDDSKSLDGDTTSTAEASSKRSKTKRAVLIVAGTCVIAFAAGIGGGLLVSNIEQEEL